MAQQNQKIRESLQLDLVNSSGSEDDAPPASTIYDPALLALSPELREKVAAREARNEVKNEKSKQESSPGNDKSPFHIFSPTGDDSRKPFEMGVDGKTIRASAGNIEETRNVEHELCCFGYMGLYPSLLLVNGICFVSF